MGRLGEELEAENEGLKILLAIRQVGWPQASDVKAHFKERATMASSAIAVVGEGDFGRFRKNGLQPLGRRSDVKLGFKVTWERGVHSNRDARAARFFCQLSRISTLQHHPTMPRINSNRTSQT